MKKIQLQFLFVHISLINKNLSYRAMKNIILTNSAVNIFIYIVFNRSYRALYKDLFKRCLDGKN